MMGRVKTATGCSPVSGLGGAFIAQPGAWHAIQLPPTMWDIGFSGIGSACVGDFATGKPAACWSEDRQPPPQPSFFGFPLFGGGRWSGFCGKRSIPQCAADTYRMRKALAKR